MKDWDERVPSKSWRRKGKWEGKCGSAAVAAAALTTATDVHEDDEDSISFFQKLANE